MLSTSLWKEEIRQQAPMNDVRTDDLLTVPGQDDGKLILA